VENIIKFKKAKKTTSKNPNNYGFSVMGKYTIKIPSMA
jgi:hypothetical protein